MKIVNTTFGEVKVEGLRFGDLRVLGEKGITELFDAFSRADEENVSAMVVAFRDIILDLSDEIFEKSMSLGEDQRQGMSVADAMDLLDAWMDESKLEEIAPRFFRLKTRILKVLPKSVKPTSSTGSGAPTDAVPKS